MDIEYYRQREKSSPRNYKEVATDKNKVQDPALGTGVSCWQLEQQPQGLVLSKGGFFIRIGHRDT
jgi:hypothetical protein